MNKSHSALISLSCCVHTVLLGSPPAQAQLISDEAARVCAIANYNRGNARLDAGDKDGAAADYR
jgi:hypothetical protein